MQNQNTFRNFWLSPAPEANVPMDKRPVKHQSSNWSAWVELNGFTTDIGCKDHMKQKTTIIALAGINFNLVTIGCVPNQTVARTDARHGQAPVPLQHLRTLILPGTGCLVLNQPCAIKMQLSLGHLQWPFRVLE